MRQQVHGPRVRAVCDQRQEALRTGDVTAQWRKREEGQGRWDSVS